MFASYLCLLTLAGSWVGGAVVPPGPPPRRYELVTVKVVVEENDVSMSFKTAFRFEAGKKAAGVVGQAAVGGRRLHMSFTPIKGKKSQYEIDAQWQDAKAPAAQPVFSVHATAGHGRMEKASQFGPAGSLSLELSLEPKASRDLPK